MNADELAALVVRQGAQLEDLEQTVSDLYAAQQQAAAAAASAPAEPPGSTDYVYSTLTGFVEQVIAPLYATDNSGGWCASWWAHDEAQVRLGATWRAWELLRLDPGMGMAKWLRDVADVQMDRLRNREHGPFRACSRNKHSVPPALPLTEPPGQL